MRATRPLDPTEVSYLLEAKIRGESAMAVVAERFAKPQNPTAGAAGQANDKGS